MKTTKIACSVILGLSSVFMISGCNADDESSSPVESMVETTQKAEAFSLENDLRTAITGIETWMISADSDEKSEEFAGREDEILEDVRLDEKTVIELSGNEDGYIITASHPSEEAPIFYDSTPASK